MGIDGADFKKTEFTSDDNKQCSICHSFLGGSIFTKSRSLDDEGNLNINKYLNNKGGIYCTSCVKNLINEIDNKIRKHNRIIRENIDQIPIVSIHSPVGWEYEVVGVVTGQSTTGTGVVSEIVSGFTDFFGLQSGMYNKKISEGEVLCFQQLRHKTLNSGGNAIVALDVDYSELGSIKGMIMVCATGTAVKVSNLDVICKNIKIENLKMAESSMANINVLNKWKNYMTRLLVN